MTRLILVVAATLLALTAVASALYVAHGSLETFATDEQQGKARLAAGAVSLISVVGAAGLAFWLRRRRG